MARGGSERGMNLRRIYIGVGVLAGIALIAIYIASPWMAAARLSQALRSGDPVAIERMVDFPSVRSSLAGQITARLNESMANDPEARNNPFAGLVSMLAPSLVNQIVNAVVTPRGLARLSREAQTARAADRAAERDRDRAGRPKGWKKAHKDDAPRVEPVLAYTGLNSFTATYDSPGKGRMVWVLGREKLFFWKLKRIEVSEIQLDDITDEAGPEH
jgi:hypothetical protein